MKISIIIPAYNAEKYLVECVESVISEFGEIAELIIVNDGSTDSTDSICRKFLSRYNNIKYINKKNEGVSAARNEGIVQAEGDWIMFLDADDKIQPNSSRVLQQLNDEVDVLLCDYLKYEKMNHVFDGKKNQIPVELMKKGILNLPKYIRQIQAYSYGIDGINNWTCWGKIYKTRLLKENNIMFPLGITHGEDLIFCYRVYMNSKKIFYYPLNLYFYRENNQSVSQKFNPKRIENTLALVDTFLKMDDSIKDDTDLYFFITDRILACIKLYYAHKENRDSYMVKITELNSLLEYPYINEAIKNCPLKKMSIGKKRSLINSIILLLLKKKRYRAAIICSKI